MPIRHLRGHGPVDIVKEAVKEFSHDDMSTYASALAYQVLFSIFPFLIFLVALLGFFDLSQFFDWLLTRAEVVLPEQAMEPVVKVIHELRQPQGGLMSFGAVVALWTASAAVRALMNALNRAYDVRETRPAWKLVPLSVVYTIGLAAMLATAAALFAIGPGAMQWLAHWFGLEQLVVVVWTWLRWPVVLIIFSMAVAIVYYVGPNVKQDFSLISPGAILSVVVWLLATVAFDFYLGHFADYSATYGSIGTIVVLLLYFYITASVLLFGAEINAAIARDVPGTVIKPPEAELAPQA